MDYLQFLLDQALMNVTGMFLVVVFPLIILLWGLWSYRTMYPKHFAEQYPKKKFNEKE